MKTISRVSIDGNSLTLEEFSAVVHRCVPVRLSPKARRQMRESRRLVEEMAAAEVPAYGINTGFGKLADQRIGRPEVEKLQLNLIRSHACGVGPPLEETEIRGILLCRANALAKGFSGVRPEVAVRLLEMLNRGVHPVVPSQGSVGASGDLAPLAHLALVLIGEGEATLAKKSWRGGTALRKARLNPIIPGAKEGTPERNAGHVERWMSDLAGFGKAAGHRRCRLSTQPGRSERDAPGL